MPQITVEISELEQRALSYQFPDIKDMMDNWLQNLSSHALQEVQSEVMNHALANENLVPQNYEAVLDYAEEHEIRSKLG